MIKNIWKIIGPETQPSLDDYLHAKNQGNQLVLSSDIPDQRIMHSDWTRKPTGHTQSKRQSQILPSFDNYLHVKNMIPIDFFKRY